MDQQIAAVRAALAATESAIAQTEAALATATHPQDVVALRSVLVDLRAERAKLKLQLASLEAAAVEVEPLGGPPTESAKAGGAGTRALEMAPGQTARMKKLAGDLTSAVTDRTVSKATLAHARTVLAKASTVRGIANGDEPAPIKPARRKRKAPPVEPSRTSAKSRRQKSR